MNTSDLLTGKNITEDNLNQDESLIYQINHREEIETVISSLEENDSAMVLKSDGGFLWKFQYGSVEVFVQLTGEEEDDLLTVWSVVLPLPAKNEPELMKKLLEMNWSGTFETCFSIFDNQVVISAQRTIADLYPSEISRIITLVASIANENDDVLTTEYGNS